METLPLSRPHAPHHSRRSKFLRGCFGYDSGDVEVWFMHRDAQKVGRGKAIALEIWEDAYGLAFAFIPPATAFNLVSGIAAGRYSDCSVGAVISQSVIQAGDVEAIGSAWLTEISICPSGACPGAICWHAGNGDAHLPAAARSLLPEWRRGRPIVQSTIARQGELVGSL